MSMNGNGLSLLAHKCGPNIFDLSTGMGYASIRDQLVRAQLLIRDLRHHDSACKRVLIVGAGVAGVSAAVACSHHGIKAVVAEVKAVPFPLLRNVDSRYVGPFMYEWPSSSYNDQSYPNLELLGTPAAWTAKWISKEPMPASTLAAFLQDWLNTNPFGGVKPDFWMNSPVSAVRDHVTKYWKHFRHGKPGPGPAFKTPKHCVDLQGHKIMPGTQFQPDYIILAAGMGTERVSLGRGGEWSGKRFWQNDDLREGCIPDWNVGIFGGGDGALQDVLRLLTWYDHPLQFMAYLQNNTYVALALAKHRAELDALEQQSRLIAAWTSGTVHELVDERTECIAIELAHDADVRERVVGGLRKWHGTVHHVVREKRFGRAYLLNRFFVHLIRHCLRLSNGANPYQIYFNAKITKKETRGKGKDLTYFIRLSATQSFEVKRIVVRYGPKDPEARSMVKLSDKAADDRTSMSSIPLPYIMAD
jgi:hypothetical protein